MAEFHSKYWWMFFGVGASIAIIRHRMSMRGGSEPFLRRLLYSVKPDIDPRSPEYRKLNLKVVILALIIVFIAIVANVLIGLFGR